MIIIKQVQNWTDYTTAVLITDDGSGSVRLTKYRNLSMYPEVFISDLYVVPHKRRQGIATALMMHAEAAIPDIFPGSDKLRAQVVTKESVKLFQKLNYRVEGLFIAYKYLNNESQKNKKSLDRK
jgi:GNAT superfamily N-acetyltransferase